MEIFTPIVKEAFRRTVQVAKFFCCVHVTSTYICMPSYLIGPSMFPTFSTGDVVFAEKLSTRLGKIGLGDFVQVQSPDYPLKIVTKRVKGVEGDVMSYSLGSDDVKTVIVPKGHVWVEGDNTDNSIDSRKFGPVPLGLIYSRIFLKVWPPKHFCWLSNKLP